jgi:hypothetical protein
MFKTILMIFGVVILIVVAILIVFALLAARWLGVHPILAAPHRDKCVSLLFDHGVRSLKREALQDSVFRKFARPNQQQDYIFVLYPLFSREAMESAEKIFPKGSRLKLKEGFRVSGIGNTSYFYRLAPLDEQILGPLDAPLYWKPVTYRKVGPDGRLMRFTEEQFRNFFELGDFVEIPCNPHESGRG